MAAPRTQLRRWIRRLLVGLVTLLALVATLLVVAVRSLDRPWLKSRLQALVRQRAGLDVDWAATRVQTFSGLQLLGVAVESPPAYRAQAPLLLRVDALDVAWTPESLLGVGSPLTAVAAHGVELTVVVDKDGRTSLSALGPAAAPPAKASPPPPSSPLSHVLADLLGSAPPVERLDLDGVGLTLLSPDASYRLSGLSLHVESARQKGRGGGWRLQTRLGERAAPMKLLLERRRGDAPDGTARVTMFAEVALSPAAATLQLDAEVVEQTLVEKTPVRRLVQLSAEARFDPKAGVVTVHVARSNLADDATTVEADLELPDRGPLLVKHAEGLLDAEHVLRLAPTGLVPVTLTRGRVSYRVDGVVVDGAPRILPGGAVTVDGELDGLQMSGLSLTEARLALSARPENGEAQGAAPAHVHGTLHFGALRFLPPAVAHGGGARVTALDGHLTIDARELQLDHRVPLQTRAVISLGGEAASLEVAQKDLQLVAEKPRLTLGARLRGSPPYAIDVDLPVANLHLTSGGRILADGPAHLTVAASELQPDALHPPRSRGKLRLTVALGPLALSLDADKHADAVDYQLSAGATSLAPLRPFLPSFLPGGPLWERMALQLTSTGRAEQILSSLPRLRHHTEVHVDRLNVAGLTATEATLVASSDGSPRKLAGQMDLKLRGAVGGGLQLGDGHLGLSFAADAAAPSLRLKLSLDGGGGLGGALTLALDFDRALKALHYDLDGHAAGLSLLAPLLGKSGLGREELARLEVGLSGKGAAFGLISEVDKDGRPRLLPEPLTTLAVAGTVELRLAHLKWAKADRELEVPKAAWQLTLTTDGANRSLHSHVEIEQLHFAAGDSELDASAVRDDLDSTIAGDLRLGVGSVDHRLSVGAIEQDFQPGYPLAQLTLDLHARRDRDGVLHVSELRLDNQAAGSDLQLHGGLDVGGERRSLTFDGELKQDLAKLWNEPQQLQGRGAASVALHISSGNLRLFHARASVKVSGANLELPRAGVAVESLDGDIPIAADLVVAGGELRYVRDASVNIYSELRYSDQHPLFHEQSFVSVKRLVTPLFTVAPLAGSLRIEHNVISLSQFETGLRGGRVTGQCSLDWKKDDTTVHLHLRASNVRAESGEPFDGNAAVELSLKGRSVEGRAEILRIGKRHLLDLLDLDDPHRSDPGVNRIRKALQLGYPDQVRLAFNHGFANARVTFGGLARLIHIGELRGIPMGPIIDRLLAPLQNQEEEP